ncbi:MAG: hypothetical protein ACM3Y8_07055, partial [Byssovorax cruenta]
IRNRRREELQWELNRSVELQRIQKQAAHHGFIGKEVDTTQLTPKEAAEEIWNNIFNSQAA